MVNAEFGSNYNDIKNEKFYVGISGKRTNPTTNQAELTQGSLGVTGARCIATCPKPVTIKCDPD